MTISVRLSEEMEDQLKRLCELTKRSKSFYIKEALAQYLEDMGDVYLALERLADPKAKYYTNEEVKAMIEAMPDDA